MNEHAGLGSLLSVLIVVGFTIILHEAERSARVAGGPPTVVVQAELVQPRPPLPDDHQTAISAPSQTPLISRRTAQPQPLVQTDLAFASGKSRRVEVVSPLASGVAGRGLRAEVVHAPFDPVRPVQTISVRSPALHPTPPSHPVQSRQPLPSKLAQSTFTETQADERLVDVALRVYGTTEAVEKLWRANRDRLTSRDAPLIEGWLLRTP